MKRKRVTVTAIGASAWICSYLWTKRKQKQAKQTNSHIPYGVYEAVFKRPLDMVLSGISIVVLSPVLLAVAIMVRLKLGGPVLFEQERPGKSGKIFRIRKFRTMTNQRDSRGNLLPDEERLTSFGKMLRSTSIDELPELFNIFKGDMSIIGPRPLLVEYLPRYNEKQRHRHDVRPGLTGYAQVSGRNHLTWEEKFHDDIEYVNHITLMTDLKILLHTIKIVRKREGISSETAATMEPFMGSTSPDMG